MCVCVCVSEIISHNMSFILHSAKTADTKVVPIVLSVSTLGVLRV